MNKCSRKICVLRFMKEIIMKKFSKQFIEIFLISFLVFSVFLVIHITTNDFECNCNSTPTFEQIHAHAIDILREMDVRFGEYGIKFPDFPFVEPYQCVDGQITLPNESREDILEKIYSLEPQSYYGNITWRNEWSWVECRYVIRLSTAVLMYIEIYRYELNQFLKTGEVIVCEYADTRCINKVADKFLEMYQ